MPGRWLPLPAMPAFSDFARDFETPRSLRSGELSAIFDSDQSFVGQVGVITVAFDVGMGNIISYR
jgi:hypothetical protein